MYEREGERSEDMRLYENIHDRVQRLLATGENNEATPTTEAYKEEEEVKQVDPQSLRVTSDQPRPQEKE